MKRVVVRTGKSAAQRDAKAVARDLDVVTILSTLKDTKQRAREAAVNVAMNVIKIVYHFKKITLQHVKARENNNHNEEDVKTLRAGNLIISDISECALSSVNEMTNRAIVEGQI